MFKIFFKLGGVACLSSVPLGWVGQPVCHLSLWDGVILGCLICIFRRGANFAKERKTVLPSHTGLSVLSLLSILYSRVAAQSPCPSKEPSFDFFRLKAVYSLFSILSTYFYKKQSKFKYLIYLQRILLRKRNIGSSNTYLYVAINGCFSQGKYTVT